MTHGRETPIEDPAAGSEPTDGPLTGVRIIELGMILAGPFSGRLLGDLGAEIIKVEAPDRLDSMREWGHEHDRGRSLWWPVITRNKKLVTLNLREPDGQELLLDLVRESDAVVENFRPGTLERWNLGYERLREVNPGIVLVRILGYGQTGPYASRAGFAAAAEAMGGLRYINGFPGEVPPRTGISLGDSLASMFGVMGLLSALYRRDALGGDGQVVDVSILESCFALMESAAPEYDRLGIVREPAGTRIKGVAPSNVFRTGDDKMIVIAANHDSLFRRLCEVMGRPEMATDPRYATHGARYENQDSLEAAIAEWAGGRDAASAMEALNDAGVVCGPINSIADIFADPHVHAREMLIDHDDPELGTFKGPGVVPRFSDTPGRVRWTGPWEPGSHNAEVYGTVAGRSDDELMALSERGIV
jgi:formyl-CoA transferase